MSVRASVGAYGGQKRALNPFELEEWVVFNHSCGCWAANWSFATAASTLSCWPLSPALHFLLLFVAVLADVK